MKKFSQREGLLLIISTSFALSVLAIIFLPSVIKARPAFYNFISAFLREGPVDYVVRSPWGYTLPSGYVGLISSVTSLFHRSEFLDGGTRLWAVFVIQAFFYLGAVIGSYATLLRARMPTWLALIGSSAVALHPFMLLNIKRFTDNSVTIPLVIAVLYTLVDSKTRQSEGTSRSWKWWIGVGLLYGATLAVRPSLLFFIGIALLYLQYPAIKHFVSQVPSFSEGVRVLAPLLVVVSVSSFVLLGLSAAVKGSPELAPKKFSYNLFIGANPYTLKSIVQNRSAEPTLKKAVEIAESRSNKRVDNFSNAQEVMIRSGTSYIRENPLEYLSLGFVKVFNIFAPDYRSAEHSDRWPPFLIYVLQTVLSLPVLLWGWIRLKASRTGNTNPPLPTGLLLVGYLAPIFLTQSDPRLRFPLDAVLFLSAVILARQVYRSPDS